VSAARVPVRVTVVDDHTLFAETMVIALCGEGMQGQCVVPDPSAPGTATLERTVLQTRPDIVLLDLDLGGGCDGMQLVATLAAQGVVVLVVTGSAEAALRGEAVFNGAATVIPKSALFEVILDTVRRVREGLPVMSREERQQLLDSWRECSAEETEIRRRFEQITRREAEVLGLLMAGQQVSEIASSRFVSESTVRTQVKSVLAKLQVRSQLSAVGLAHRIGWCPPAGEDLSEVDGRPRASSNGRSRSTWAVAG